eukprot:scaffold6494_cov31-Attheya_sp.AAC.1
MSYLITGCRAHQHNLGDIGFRPIWIHLRHRQPLLIAIKHIRHRSILWGTRHLLQCHPTRIERTIEDAISDEDIRKQRIIKRLISVQDMKAQWRAIKRAVGKKNGGTVKEIEVMVTGESV